MAVANGATIIEKHFTLNRAEGGVDSTFSIEPKELKNLIFDLRKTKEAMGKDNIFSRNRKGSQHARSIYCFKNINKSEKITKNNVKIIRPGYGLPPKYLKDILGKTAKKNIERGDRITWDLIK